MQIKKKLHADRALLAVSKDVSTCGGKVVARIHMTDVEKYKTAPVSPVYTIRGVNDSRESSHSIKKTFETNITTAE